MSRQSWRHARTRRMLAQGVRGMVVLPEDPDAIWSSVERQASRLEDAYWDAVLRLPFSWQRFHDWWAARYWAMPRDIRREPTRLPMPKVLL